MPLNSTRGGASAKGFGFTAGGGLLIEATGGTITYEGSCAVHTFTGPGSFIISKISSASPSKVDYLVIAGGGGGGQHEQAGGGGAGGYRESVPSPATWTASPLANPGGALTVTATTYPITVGAGGTAANPSGCTQTPGNSSIFSTITSAGGGKGGIGCQGGPQGGGAHSGDSGGSGGGGGTWVSSPKVGGSGNSPPTAPAQGTNGGDAGPNADAGPYGGGGGGATVAGTPGCNQLGIGGTGAGTAINSSPTVGTSGPSPSLRYYAGGGGGGGYSTPGVPAPGGTGGGGKGGSNAPGGTVVSGTTNTGGGGGGAANGFTVSGAGGSGIVIIRYRYR